MYILGKKAVCCQVSATPSEKLRADFLGRFYDNLPPKPYFAHPLDYRQVIRSKKDATRWPRVQFNPPHLIRYLCFDIDNNDPYLAVSDAGLPHPSAFVVDLRTGRGHVLYELRSPVATHSAARLPPQEYVKAIQSAMTIRLGADSGYVGHLCKNPLHDRHHVYATGLVYDLADLAAELDLPYKKSNKQTSPDFVRNAEGRNTSLHRAGVKWAARNWTGMPEQEELTRAVHGYIDQLNQRHYADTPLSYSELIRIAKSCAKWALKKRPNCGCRKPRPNEGILRPHLGGLSEVERKSEGGRYTTGVLRARSLAACRIAFRLAVKQGGSITVQRIAAIARLCVRTVQRLQARPEWQAFVRAATTGLANSLGSVVLGRVLGRWWREIVRSTGLYRLVDDYSLVSGVNASALLIPPPS